MQIIEEAIRDRRISRHGAAALAGVTYQTLLNWEDWGEEGREPYATFFDRLTRAEAEAETGVVSQLLETKYTDGPKFWLERRFPDRYGRKDSSKVELTGDGGGPVKHEHTGSALERLSGAIARLADAGTETAGDGEPD